MTMSLKDEFRTTIDRLIDSEDDYDIDKSREEDQFNLNESKDFSNRFIDSQKIGYKLTEEIRKLRSDLAKERRENRLLRVTNENLQEQLNVSEKRMEQLELKEINASKKFQIVEESLKAEVQRAKALEEELRILKHERRRVKREEEELVKSSKSMRLKYDETSQQLIYWKECVTAYEAKIKELVREKELQDQQLEESKRRMIFLENFVFQMRSKLIRFHESCTNLLGMEGNLDSLNQKSQSLLTSTDKLSEEEFHLLDSLFILIKKRIQMYSDSRKKYKDQLHKLMTVVKMYEEMVPSLDLEE